MPYVDTFITPQALHIAVWKLTEDVSQLLSLWGDAVLPENFDKATSDKRRREILATALIIRQYWGCDVPVRHAENGAPLIDSGFISISHTTSHIAVAFHPTRPVGVDIEVLGTKAIRVAGRFMSSSEVAALPEDDATFANGLSLRAVAIHLAWSVKEAVYKIHPNAVEFREDIILDSFSNIPYGFVNVNLPAENHRMYAYYTLYDGCSLAWALD